MTEGLTDKFWGIDSRADSPAPAAAIMPQATRSSGYFAAEYSRITSSLVNEARHINDIIRWQGYTLLSRSRQMADNNPYAVKFLQMVVNNVAGPNPFQLQGRITTRQGKPDTIANNALEAAWGKWSKARNCDRYGRLSLADIYRLSLRIIARDGECLIRLHEGRKAGAFGLQLQIIDTDRLDFNLNKALADGGAIHAGVEVDQEGRTVAYHLRKSRPVDWQYGNHYRGEYERVPSEQMLHLFVPLSAEQVRGVPWIYAALINLNNLGAFEEAAIIAARVGAAKMGFIESDPNYPAGGDDGGERDKTGARIMDAEPGTFEELPFGKRLASWDPHYPDAQVGPFMKSCLRGIAAAWGVAYHSLAGDLEAVNFSSGRLGTLDERDHWMLLQNWFTEHACEEILERFVPMANLTGKLGVNGSLERYMSAFFQPRRWSWVDPLKDVQANIEAIKWGLKSRTAIISEQGQEVDDVFTQLATEELLAADKKINISDTTIGGPTNAPQDDQPAE